MYEHFEHTADLGFRIRAENLDELFVEAAHCLFAAIVENLDTIEPLRAVEIEIAGTNRDFLFFDWLKTLLYHFDADHLLFGKFEVHVRDDGLTAKAWGEPLDRTRHTLEHEVKAITYHDLRVEKMGDLWEAEVIVDI